jgi:hypothetical protein
VRFSFRIGRGVEDASGHRLLCRGVSQVVAAKETQTNFVGFCEDYENV